MSTSPRILCNKNEETLYSVIGVFGSYTEISFTPTNDHHIKCAPVFEENTFWVKSYDQPEGK